MYIILLLLLYTVIMRHSRQGPASCVWLLLPRRQTLTSRKPCRYIIVTYSGYYTIVILLLVVAIRRLNPTTRSPPTAAGCYERYRMRGSCTVILSGALLTGHYEAVLPAVLEQGAYLLSWADSAGRGGADGQWDTMYGTDIIPTFYVGYY